MAKHATGTEDLTRVLGGYNRGHGRGISVFTGVQCTGRCGLATTASMHVAASHDVTVHVTRSMVKSKQKHGQSGALHMERP